MKTVSIHTFVKSKNGYEVYLGNGTVHRFTSQKATSNFISHTNKFLNQELFTLNHILGEVYTHSRELWILSTTPDFDRKLKTYIEHIEHFINGAEKRSALKNGNYYVFIDLKKACEVFKVLIKHLQSFKVIQTTDTLRRHKLADLFHRVHLEAQRIQDYGQSEAFGFCDTSTIEDQSALTYSLKIA